MRSPHMSLNEKDKRYLWHPFTQMQDWLQEEITIIERGEGAYLFDTEGRRYIDGVSSLWTNMHGHQKKEIDDAICDQLSKIAHSTFLGLSNIPAIELAERLVTITPPGLEKVFYADSGSEAMEVAFKVAYQYHCQKKNPEPEKTLFVHLENSYHGDTLGSVSVGGIDLFHKIYKPLLFETCAVPAPYCYRCPCGKEKDTCVRECLAILEKTLREKKDVIAALVIEPRMQGAAGMINQPEGYLARVRELTRDLGLLLICDEVATGFGRTGRLFACEREDVSPDIMAVGKGITGGYLPLSATLFTEEIFNAFLGAYEEQKTFFHGHTYTGNQLAARAALANIDIFEKEKLIQEVQKKSAYIQERLCTFASLPQVGDIRQEGMMIGIELVRDTETKEAYGAGEKMGIRVITEAKKRGVIIRPLGNVIVLMPTLSIDNEVLNELLDVVEEAIRIATT